MMKKRIFGLWIMLIGSLLLSTANLSAQDRLTFGGPWGPGKVTAWVFVAVIAFVMLLIIFKVVTSSFKSQKSETVAEKSPEATPVVAQTSAPAASQGTTDEVFAAIAMALYESEEEVHDLESNILTFNNLESPSPWSSKVLEMREVPVRR
ncbi:MAG: OadG family protein [Tannerella sp.]|jgi:hypothetical protein|nr:OadG family protein [Tannerella sp.]